MSVLTEWLGSGGVPVALQIAERRAEVCSGCLFNTAPNWWQKMTADPIAATIRKMLEVRHSLGMKLADEEALQMCSCCGCCTRLKVHVPIEQIQAHSTPEQLAAFPAWCWIKRELR